MDCDESSSRVLTSGRLADYFEHRVRNAVDNQGAALDEHTQAYVVNLLASFATRDALVADDRTDLLEEPLAVQMIRAMQAEPGRRFRLLRKIGDVSLYMTGYFSEALDRAPVDRSYYVDLGAGAYRRAAGSIAGSTDNPFRQLYCGLAARFGEIVEVLNEVSEHDQKRDVDILRLYDRYLETGSARLAARLAQLGVPVRDIPRQAH